MHHKLVEKTTVVRFVGVLDDIPTYPRKRLARAPIYGVKRRRRHGEDVQEQHNREIVENEDSFDFSDFSQSDSEDEKSFSVTMLRREEEWADDINFSHIR